MIRFRTSLVLLASLSAALAPARPDPEVVRDSTVQVAILDGEETVRFGSGFAVAGGTVVTAAHLVADEERIVVVPLATRAELVARVLHSDERSDLAVLAVNGLELPPLKLAMDGFDPGRLVYAVGVWSATAEPVAVAAAEEDVPLSVAEGSVGRHDELPEDDGAPAVPLIVHNAMISAAGYGGPLLNECGEVAGVNRGAPGTSARRLRRGLAPANVVHAVAGTGVAAVLSDGDVAFGQSGAPCAGALADAKAQADAAAAELETKTEQLEEATGQVEATQEQLEETQREEDAAAARAAEAESRVGELEAEYAEAVRTGSAQTEELEARLEAARGEQAEARAAVGALEGQVTALQDQLRQQAAADRFRLIATISVAGVLLLAVLVVVFVIRRQHARQLAVAQEEAARARRDAADARTAPGDQVTHPDCLLTGVTGDGHAVSLKIPGALLGGNGAVIGRSPRDSTLLIDDRTLSREHARFFADGDAIHVEDLDSTNGTRINGRRMSARTPSMIGHGDALELGATKLRLAVTR